MAKYTPKVDDVVFMENTGFVRYVVVGLDHEKQTAVIESVTGVLVPIHDVPWSRIRRLDDSQNALRIVREATEGK